MKKPPHDYRGFRLSEINDPKYRHLKLLLGWVIYFLLYFLTERLIPEESCMPVHIWLDDLIPFCEWFVIPYVFWYVMIVATLGYFLLYDVDRFRRLQIYIIITQIVAMAIYIVFPNRQDLRPAEFPRDNFLTRCVALLYRADTNTCVCPSLHVAISIGLVSAWSRKKDAPKLLKALVAVLAVLVCLSTMFIKQHSAADFLAALPVCLLAEAIAYGRDRRPSRSVRNE